MKFLDLIKKSWGEYRFNLLAILAFLVLLILIPALIGGFLITKSAPNDLLIKKAELEGKLLALNITNSSEMSEEQINRYNTLYNEYYDNSLKFIPYMILNFGIFILISLFYLFSISGLFVSSFSSKYSFKEIFRNGRKKFLKGIGIVLLASLSVLAVFVVFFIISSIFGLLLYNPYISLILSILFICGELWLITNLIFSFSILMNSDKGVWECYKEGFRFLKNRWFRAFGYLLIAGIIAFAFIMVYFTIYVNIVGGMDVLIASSQGQGIVPDSVGLQVLNYCYSIFFLLVLLPLFVIYIKNVYLFFQKK